MSVSMTEQAVVERRKTVTRRKGWWLDKRGRHLVKAGDRLTLVRKAMGRKPGEPLVRLAEVEVVSVRRESLDELSTWQGEEHLAWQEAELRREGFDPAVIGPAAFVHRYFTAAQGIPADAEVTRIEWRYLDGGAS